MNDPHWTVEDKVAAHEANIAAILFRHFSFVEELEKQRNAAMADYDRVALVNAELRANLSAALLAYQSARTQSNGNQARG